MQAIAAAVGCTRELDGKISVAKDTDCFGYKTEKRTGTEPESPFLLAGLHGILRHCVDSWERTVTRNHGYCKQQYQDGSTDAKVAPFLQEYF